MAYEQGSETLEQNKFVDDEKSPCETSCHTEKGRDNHVSVAEAEEKGPVSPPNITINTVSSTFDSIKATKKEDAEKETEKIEPINVFSETGCIKFAEKLYKVLEGLNCIFNYRTLL